jgi:uncharacterized protein (DUF2147 family)
MLIQLAAFAVIAAAASPQQIEGRWRSPGGNSIIEIAPCGSDLCGTVAWASAKAKADARKTTSELVGTQILTALKAESDGRWVGRLFVPDKNLRVTAKVQAVGARQMKVAGCAAGRALCKAEVWNRFDGPLPASE